MTTTPEGASVLTFKTRTQPVELAERTNDGFAVSLL
jgi:hypothetical protein